MLLEVLPMSEENNEISSEAKKILHPNLETAGTVAGGATGGAARPGSTGVDLSRQPDT